MEGKHHGRTGLKARVALVGVTAIGLAMYGLLGSGGKSAAVPFQGKPVSTVATDHYAAKATFDKNNGVDVVAMGPSHSLYYYWEIKGTWYGPLQAGGAGTTYSGPGFDSAAFATFNGDLDAAVEGPNHTLYFFWLDASSNTWHGPLQIGGAGSTWSKPAVLVDSKGHVNVAAQGPNGSLLYYWAIGGAWNGPLQIAGQGATLSVPSMYDESGSNCGANVCIGVAALGKSGQSVVYWNLGGQWLAPSTSGQNQEFSSPNLTSDGSPSPSWFDLYQGPGNSLIDQQSGTQGGSNTYCVVGGAGTTFGAPSDVGSDAAFTSTASTSTVAFNYEVAGPGGSLYAYWFTGPAQPTTCPAAYGPLQLSGPGTIHSVPTNQAFTDSASNTVLNVFVEGPSHSLWLFWSSAGSWYGPLQVGGPGTTFDSAS